MSTSTTTPHPTPPGLAASVGALAAAALGGLAIGALTSFSQGWLPFHLNSLSNSSGSWSVAAFLLALLPRRRWAAVAAAAAALACMMLGYDLASVLRGYHASTGTTAFWLTAAVLVGPFLGLTAHSLRFRTGFAPWGTGMLSGVLIGEGVYGHLVVAETTSVAYWSASVAAGLAFLVWACARRFPARRPVLTSVAVTAVVGGAFVAVYGMNPIQWFWF
ncbi:DUF6518 family protein [Nocardiopsis sp. NPDC006198]|uniref:DUF6518 family protein n=1 Tax=Nocardiopsis sp. NPDC006198 TaxID=3154472 RepID=UPI0033BE3237